jgi:hypothetical protein
MKISNSKILSATQENTIGVYYALKLEALLD